MDTIGRGIVAGFIAMLAVSLLLDPLVLLGGTRWTQESGLGLRLHFFVGPVVWGAAFAFFHDHVRGPSWLRGIVFASALWILVNAILALTGHAASTSAAVALAAGLAVHIVYGALLGAIYGALGDREAPRPRRDQPVRP
jgi:uncharacterized protein DUF6789